MNKIMLILLCIATLGGCVNKFTQIDRANEKIPLNPEKATIVGFISEGYITQPHGLNVVLDYKNDNPKEIKTLLIAETLGYPDEIPEPNILGNTFIFQVPAGEYEIARWFYTHLKGYAPNAPIPLKFKVKAGETAYIGQIHGNALTMCLSNRDNYDEDIKEIKQAHKVLENIEITNASTNIQFSGWPSDASTDIMGKGLCKIL